MDSLLLVIAAFLGLCFAIVEIHLQIDKHKEEKEKIRIFEMIDDDDEVL